MLVVLLALGASHDLWRARHPRYLPLEERRDGRGAMPSSEWGGAAGSAAPADPQGVGRSGPSAAGETAGGGAPGAARARSATFRVDINVAGTAELDALPGVGPVLAERIVAHRRRYGRYRRLEDLLAVRGIGPRLLERLAPHVAFGPGSP